MSLSPEHFRAVSDLVRRESAIVLDEGKEYLVEARLLPLAKGEGFSSLADLVKAIGAAGSGPLRRKVVEAMTTNETYFFREPDHFELLRTRILPALADRRRAVRRLVIWSAACSTGQEPYSVAMLVKDRMPELHAWQVGILASDLSGEVLSRAREAVYTQAEVNRGLPAANLVKYFERSGTSWRLKPGVKELVRFFELNLAGAWAGIPPVDVVLLRNVLIYFDAEVKRQILGKVRGLLRPDGYLLIGGAEGLSGAEGWTRVTHGKTSYYLPPGHPELPK